MTLSKIDFAKLAKVSRQRIYQMIKDGNLICSEESGKLDTENKINKNYLKEKDRRDGKKTSDIKREKAQAKSKKKLKKEKPTPKKKGKIKPKKKTKPVKENIDIIPKDLDDENDDPDLEYDKYKLQCIKLEGDIKKIDIINAEKRNELIPRVLVKKFIDQIYQIDSQEFLQLSSHLTAKICQGIFKTDDEKKLLQVTKLIDKESYKTLEHIQKKINMFLTGLQKTIEDDSK